MKTAYLHLNQFSFNEQKKSKMFSNLQIELIDLKNSLLKIKFKFYELSFFINASDVILWAVSRTKKNCCFRMTSQSILSYDEIDQK